MDVGALGDRGLWDGLLGLWNGIIKKIIGWEGVSLVVARQLMGNCGGGDLGGLVAWRFGAQAGG